MNIRLLALNIFFPESLKQRTLRELFKAAGEAFSYSAPEIEVLFRGLSSQKLLVNFARFTVSQYELAIRNQLDMQQIQERLFQNTKRLGIGLRRALKIRNYKEIMQASRTFYKLLGINFHGQKNGEVTITYCFFSRYYTSQTCVLISAMDAGIAAGLTGGRILKFSQRITEGQKCCKAKLLEATEQQK